MASSTHPHLTPLHPHAQYLTTHSPHQQVLKFMVGLAHAFALFMSLFGVIPFACWTSVMVCYGYANKMVKLAEEHWSGERFFGVLVGA